MWERARCSPGNIVGALRALEREELLWRRGDAWEVVPVQSGSTT
ncbi:hypothetical protein [Planomonospora parontospora]|nr:hypothetical protein [Planomonospora parontospora]